MNTRSQLYQTIISGIHSFDVKINIAGTDYGMDVLTSLKTARTVFGGGSPEIGLAPSGSIGLSLYADTDDIPRMATMTPYYRVKNDTQVSEWIAKGTYFVDTREVNTHAGLVTLTGYDAMLKGERRYPSTSHAWPYTDLAVVREIAGFLDVTVDSRTTALMTSAFGIPLPTQFTIRETLQFIGALYGGSFIITDQNTLLLVCLWNLAQQADVTLGSTHRLVKSPAFPACTGVKFILDDDTEITAGTSTGYVYEITCPFATQAAANALLTRMQGFVYRPWSAESAILDPAAELGDTISVDSFLSGLYSCELNFNSICASTVAAPQDEALDHEYPYETTQDRKYTRKINTMESELSIQANAIAARVTKTGGDSSSFGWYLDSDKFQLLSNGSEVMLVNSSGLVIRGQIVATSGTIGGCVIENGVLKINAANITSINASNITAGTLSVDRLSASSITGSKIASETIGSGNMADSAAINRVIGSQAVSYGKTSFQSTLDQVSVNEADIDTLFGYFTGAASFSAVLTGSLAINSHYLALETITIGGVSRKVVTWT